MQKMKSHPNSILMIHPRCTVQTNRPRVVTCSGVLVGGAPGAQSPLVRGKCLVPTPKSSASQSASPSASFTTLPVTVVARNLRLQRLSSGGGGWGRWGDWKKESLHGNNSGVGTVPVRVRVRYECWYAQLMKDIDFLMMFLIQLAVRRRRIGRALSVLSTTQCTVRTLCLAGRLVSRFLLFSVKFSLGIDVLPVRLLAGGIVSMGAT